ncbi:MAG: O-antigen ligase domain-containing protein [Tannerellaceae bacterium]|jgi:hypothetical protein|nr:O-antigen ligase domain-containing protein [Tannerellaceae bacterium]
MTQAHINKYFYIIFLFTLTFGVLLYDTIGFDYTDECCALFLFVLFVSYLFTTKDWAINKAFLTTIGIFLFYLCYSLAIGSNTKAAIASDLLIQIKPYLAFFCVYSLLPHLDAGRKKLLQDIALVYWGLLCLVGIGDIFIPRLIFEVVGHPAYYAASVIACSFCYFICSRFTRLDRLTFLVLLSIGILSGRSKFYGFYAFACFAILFLPNLKQFKWNLRNVLILACMLATIIFVAWEKVYFYFYQTVTDEVEKDMIARYILYVTTPDILRDYFPLGSGFATYATYSSGLYYSHIYADYGIDGVWGMTKEYYNFIADTYYPSLAQFGVLGILLYATFWVYILRKAYLFYRARGNIHYFTVVVMLVGFFGIEGTTDSTFTTHRGFFLLMMLGLVLGCMKHEQNEDTANQ